MLPYIFFNYLIFVSIFLLSYIHVSNYKNKIHYMHNKRKFNRSNVTWNKPKKEEKIIIHY